MAEPITVQVTDEVDLKALTRYFYALKEEWRLLMLRALAEADELTVSELAQRLNISQPLLSWHLRRLRQAHIVTVRKEGRESYYALERERMAAYQAEFERLLQP